MDTDGQTDGWLDVCVYVRIDEEMDARAIIRAFNSSWATAPCLSSLSLLQEKKKKNLLTSPEQGEVERKSRQAGKQVGVEKKVSGRDRAEKQGKEEGGLKGFECLSHKRRLMKDRGRSHLQFTTYNN